LLSATLLAGCGKVAALPAADGAMPASDGAVATDDGAILGDATIITNAGLFGNKVGARVGNIDLISTAADNTVLAVTRSDARGNATIKVAPGGSVTAVYRHIVDPGTDLITWVGVKPGDTLTFGSRSFSPSGQKSTDLGSQTYTWPSQPGATDYVVFTPCTSTGVGTNLTVTLVESSLCHEDPMDIVFTASDDTAITHYGFRTEVPFESGSTVSILSWMPVQSGSINITGLPSEISSLEGKFFTIYNSGNARGLGDPYTGTPTGGAFSATFRAVPTGKRTVGSVTLARSGFNSIQILDAFSVDTKVQTVAAPQLTPWLQGRPTASPALRTASWFIVGEASSVYDGQLLDLSWSHVGSTKFAPYAWHFILPPGQTSITYPALPPPFDDAIPLSTEVTNAAVRVFEIASVKGYDMVRAMPSADLMCLDCAVKAGDLQRVVITPPEGTLQ
jgi:hypothetical protein